MSKIHDDNDLTVSAFNRDDNEPTVTAVRKDATVIMNTAELEEKLRRARQEALNEAGIKRDYVLSPDGELDFDALLRDEEGFESEPQEDGDDYYDEEEAEASEAYEASPAAKRIIARRAEEKRRKKRTVTIVCIAAAIVALLVVGTLIIRSTAQNKAYNDSFELAQSYYYDGKYDEALSELRQALSVKKTDECLLLMSECYEAKSDYVNAIAILESSNSGSSVISKRLEQLRKAKEAYDEGKTVIICGEPFDADTEILDLSGKGIKSSRLSELSRLEKLKTLNLSDNEIIGLSFLKGLNELTTLDLRSNKIKDISVLSGLTELRTLYLDDNRIEDFSPLYSLHNLGILYITGMDISETQLAELKTALPSCIIYSDDASPDVVEITLGGRTFKSDVTSLDLSGCGISDISLLSLCTSLEKLDLGDNSIKDLTPLMDITGLKSLDLENNKIDDVRPLMGLKKLEYLNLAGNKIDSVTALSDLKKLNELHLSRNPLKGISALSDLSSLKTLCLDFTGIKDASLQKLYKLDALRTLLLDGNEELTQSAVDELKKKLPGCAVSFTPVTVTLELGGKSFKNDVTELSLVGCGISDISVLSRCTSLKKLDLSDNPITDASPLYGLSSLRELYISGTSLTPDQIAELEAKLPDCTVYVM